MAAQPDSGIWVARLREAAEAVSKQLGRISHLGPDLSPQCKGAFNRRLWAWFDVLLQRSDAAEKATRLPYSARLLAYYQARCPREDSSLVMAEGKSDPTAVQHYAEWLRAWRMGRLANTTDLSRLGACVREVTQHFADEPKRIEQQRGAPRRAVEKPEETSNALVSGQPSGPIDSRLSVITTRARERVLLLDCLHQTAYCFGQKLDLTDPQFTYLLCWAEQPGERVRHTEVLTRLDDTEGGAEPSQIKFKIKEALRSAYETNARRPSGAFHTSDEWGSAAKFVNAVLPPGRRKGYVLHLRRKQIDIAS